MSANHLIIFDMDGTIIDSGRIIVDAVVQSFMDHGLTPPSDQMIRGGIGLSLDNAIRRLIPDGDEEIIRKVGEGYKNRFIENRTDGARPAPYPGLLELIHELDSQNYLLGIATGKSDRGLSHTLAHLGMEKIFLTLQTADRHPSKPHPSMLHQAMNDVGIEAVRTIMIGDTSFDMEMAKNAGTHALGVDWGYHEADDLRAAGASHVVKTADHLAAFLNDWSAAA